MSVENPGGRGPGSRLPARLPQLIVFSLFGFAFFAPISISASQISLGLGLVGWLACLFFSPASPGKKLVFSPIGRAFLVFLAAGFLSVLGAEDKFSALYSLRSCWIFLAFLLAANWIRSLRDLKICLGLLLLVCGAACYIGVFQYTGGLSYFLFGHQILPYHEHAVGFFGNSMTFGGLLLVVLLALIPFFFPRSSNWRDWLWLIPLGLIIIGLILTKQRGVWLGFGGGIIFLGILQGRKALAAIIIGLLVVLGITYKLSAPLLLRSQTAFADYQDPTSSLGNRILLWKTGGEMLRKSPLTGVGPGQFERHALGLIRQKVGNRSRVPITAGHAHSNPVQILATLGILGFLAYLYLWIVIFRESFRAWRRAPPLASAFSAGVLSALVGFHLEGFFEYNFGDAEILSVVWFLVGAMIATGRFQETEASPEA